MRRGLTLVETLVVLAIIAVVAGLLLPVLAQARRKGYDADDLSRLRQLGAAGNIYHEQHGTWPYGTADLVASGMVPRELANLNGDKTAAGLANEVAEFRSKLGVKATGLQVPYKNSPIGLREYRISAKNLNQFIETGAAGGWLLDFTTVKKGVLADFMDATGNYRRLCFDGSVQTRTLKAYDCSYKGTPSPCRMPETWFVDPDEEMKKWMREL